MDRIHPMRGPNKFKVGVFSPNSDGGLTLTRVPERWPAKWSEIVEVARMADRAGMEFVLPIARWKGFGGEMNSREWSFETFTFAAALATATDNIAVFSTVHVPMVHPVFAAKALTTIDHASNGRAGLNIVCGWNPEEFAIFGLPLIEERYEQGLEWFEIMNRIYTEDQPFDFSGRFYTLKSVSGKPRPVQQPRPITLNAAFSPPGRDFAARAADYLLTSFTTIEKGREHIEDMAKRAAATGRALGVYGTCHVVCRPTQDEAEAYYEHYAVTMADQASLDFYTAQKEKFSGSHAPEAYREHRKRLPPAPALIRWSAPRPTSPREMVRIAKWPGSPARPFHSSIWGRLPYFIAIVLPLLREPGAQLVKCGPCLCYTMIISERWTLVSGV